MAKRPRPKVTMWPDEDKEWGGYREAVQCIHCHRWMVVDFDHVYYSEKTGRRVHVQIFKCLNWDGYNWYIDRQRHNPGICESSRDRTRIAKQEGFRTWKAYGTWLEFEKRRQEE